MAGIIDSFFVQIGLDAGPFTVGQREADQAWTKTKDQTVAAAKQIEENTRKLTTYEPLHVEEFLDEHFYAIAPERSLRLLDGGQNCRCQRGDTGVHFGRSRSIFSSSRCGCAGYRLLMFFPRFRGHFSKFIAHRSFSFFGLSAVFGVDLDDGLRPLEKNASVEFLQGSGSQLRPINIVARRVLDRHFSSLRCNPSTSAQASAAVFISTVFGRRFYSRARR
jgi:hypothetical protein